MKTVCLSIFFCLLLVFPVMAADEVDVFTNSLSIEECVGQLLLVGLPASIEDYDKTEDVQKIISTAHVGGFFVSRNNYKSFWKYPLETKINKIIAFHNYIQIEAMRSERPIPLFIAGDFETPEINSLSGIIVPPIEPLTLSMVDGELISLAGRILANQLRVLGVNMMLGPNLDVDQQNSYKQRGITYNRVFGGNTGSIISNSSHYINGLRQENIAVIGKHFPGHVGISASPHYELPVSSKSYSELIKEIIPYPSLKEHLNGVMTAHIEFPLVKDCSDRFVTTSKLLVHDTLRGDKSVFIGDESYPALGFDNHVLITDDLSAMAAVKEYMQKERLKGLSDLAYRAILAGHDMVLVCSVSGNKKDDSLHYADVLKLYNDLLVKFKAKDAPVAKLREAVSRVLRLKMNLFHQGGEYSIFSQCFTSNYSSSFFNPPFLRERGVESVDEVYRRITKSAMTKINSVSDFQKQFRLARKIGVVNYIEQGANATRAAIDKIYREGLPEKKVEIYTEERSRFSIEKTKNKLKQMVADSDLVIINLSAPYEMEMAKCVAQLGDGLSDKIVFFMHCSPKMFPWEYLSRFNIAGCFSNVIQAYSADIEYLKSESGALPRVKLPISLGENGSFYSISDHSRKAPAGPVSPHFGTEFEQETMLFLNKELQQKNKQLEQQNSTLERANFKISGLLSVSCWIFIVIGCGYSALTLYRYIQTVSTVDNTTVFHALVKFIQCPKFFFRFLAGVAIIMLAIVLGKISGINLVETIKSVIQ